MRLGNDLIIYLNNNNNLLIRSLTDLSSNTATSDAEKHQLNFTVRALSQQVTTYLNIEHNTLQATITEVFRNL